MSSLVVTSGSFGLRLRFLKSGRDASRFNERPVDGRGRRIDGLSGATVLVVVVVVRRVVTRLEAFVLKRDEPRVGPKRERVIGDTVVVVVTGDAGPLVTVDSSDVDTGDT